MSTRQLLVKNSFWLALVELVSKLIMFGVTVSIVRYLGPDQFGSYNLAFSYVAIFMILFDFGLSTVVTRDLAKHPENSNLYLSNLLGLKFLLSFLVLALVLVSFIFIPTSPSAKLLILAVTVYSFLQNLTFLFGAFFSSQEKMELVFLSRLSYYLGLLISVFVVIFFKGRPLDFIIAYIIATTLSALYAAFLIKKSDLKITLSFDKKFWQDLLAEALPFIGLTVAGTIYSNVDTLLIGHYFGNLSAGFYQSAYKILFAFQSVNFINNAIFPRLNVFIHRQESTKLRKLISYIVSFSLLVLIPLAIAITLFRKEIVNLIYGPAYLGAAPVMAILIWSGVVNYFRILTSNLLFAKEQQQQVFYAVVTGTIFNLLLNFFLLPRFSYTTAAWNLLISEILILIITLKDLVFPSHFKTT